MKIKNYFAAAVCGEVLLTSSLAFAKETEEIRVGSILALGTAAPFAAQELGYYEEAGLDISVTEFSDGAALMEAFAAGELDVALVGIAPAAAWFGKGLDLKVVAGTNGGGHVLMTREDSGIENVSDLKDRIVAEPGVATVTDALLRAEILAEAGLNPDRDVILIPGMKPADMATALMATKEADAIITWEPYASLAMADYGDQIRVIYDAGPELKTEEAEGFYPGNVVIASGDFIESHEDLLDIFLAIHAETTDYLNEDETANETLASILQLDVSVVENARMRTDFHSEINQETALEVLQWSVDLGYLEELPDAEEFFILKEDKTPTSQQEYRWHS